MSRHSERPNQKQIEEARRVLRSAYYTTIKNIADNIAEDFEKYDRDDDSQRDSLTTRIHEETESELTYTKDAWDALYNSDNTDATFEFYDEMGQGLVDPKGNGLPNNWVEALAYPAIERDIIEALKAFHKIEV